MQQLCCNVKHTSVKHPSVLAHKLIDDAVSIVMSYLQQHRGSSCIAVQREHAYTLINTSIATHSSTAVVSTTADIAATTVTGSSSPKTAS